MKRLVRIAPMKAPEPEAPLAVMKKRRLVRKPEEEVAVAKPVGETAKLMKACEKLERISLYSHGEEVEGKAIAKDIADMLGRGMAYKESKTDLNLFGEPFATPDSYGDSAPENDIDDLFRAVKGLDLKLDYRTKGSAWYDFASAKMVYPSTTLENAIEFFNDSAEERGDKELTKKTAEFVGNELEAIITSVADAKHDAAIWRALAK
jgi:hypothetical protein